MPGLDGFRVLSRRRFLVAALGLGGVALGAGSWWRLGGPSVEGLRALSPRAYRTLLALAEALFPGGGAFERGGDASLARAFDAFLADEPEWNRRDLGRALVLLEYGPVLLEGRAATFSGLDAEARLAHFEVWTTSERATFRQVALAFRKFLSLVFYDQPALWPHIGYDGAAARRWAP